MTTTDTMVLQIEKQEKTKMNNYETNLTLEDIEEVLDNNDYTYTCSDPQDVDYDIMSDTVTGILKDKIVAKDFTFERTVKFVSDEGRHSQATNTLVSFNFHDIATGADNIITADNDPLLLLMEDHEGPLTVDMFLQDDGQLVE